MKQIRKSIVAQTKKRDSKGHFVKQYSKELLAGGITEETFGEGSEGMFAPNATIPHVHYFRGRATGQNGWYFGYDQAVLENRKHAKAMRNDLTIAALIRQRKLQTSSLNYHFVPQDENDPNEVYLCKELKKDFENIPRLRQVFFNLLDAIWYGKFAVAFDFGFDFSTGTRKLKAKGWSPINGDKLRFKSEPPYNVGYVVDKPTGLRPVENLPDLGIGESWTESDMEAVVIHKNEIFDAPFDDLLLAGGINGVGIRDQVYYEWWLRMQSLGWLFDTLERYGAGGIKVWWYDQGNPKSKEAAENSAKAFTQNQNIIMPRPVSKDTNAPYGVEIHELNTGVVQEFIAIIDGYFGANIRRYISGIDNYNTSEKQVELLKTNAFNIIKFDADNLAETLSETLVKTFIKYNYPQYHNKHNIKFKFDLEAKDIAQYMEACQRFVEMGGSVIESEVRSVIGLGDPKPEDKVLQKAPEQSVIKALPINHDLTEDNPYKPSDSDKKEIGNLANGF